jgi:hypothetical protein
MSTANENKDAKSQAKKKEAAAASRDPVHVIREGAIAASIWSKQSPSGYAYFDFTLSRSWKSESSGKSGYSTSFFDKHRDQLTRVVEKATSWIAEKQTKPSASEGTITEAA